MSEPKKPESEQPKRNRFIDTSHDHYEVVSIPEEGVVPVKAKKDDDKKD